MDHKMVMCCDVDGKTVCIYVNSAFFVINAVGNAYMRSVKVVGKRT